MDPSQLKLSSLIREYNLPVVVSLIATKLTGMRPGPPSLPIGFATNHSWLLCAITMIGSPRLASSSSALSALKSCCTTPYSGEGLGLDLGCEGRERCGKVVACGEGVGEGPAGFGRLLAEAGIWPPS